MPTYRYDPFTDRSIEQGNETVIGKIDPTTVRTVQLTELTDESVEKIADAIVRKLRERREDDTVGREERR